VLLTRWSYGKKELAYLLAHHEEFMEKAKKVEQQNLDPELEYEIAKAHKENSGNKAPEQNPPPPGA